MPSFIPLIIRHEYTDIIFFWACLYRRYNINGNHSHIPIDIEQLVFH